MPTLEVQSDLSIHYIDSNSSGSPTVLLLHGLGASAKSWTFQIPALVQAGCRPLAPDMRGFGESGYPGYLSIESMARDMALLLSHLEAAPCITVGISMGGTVAQYLTLDYPNLVRKLVLVNTFASLRPKKLSVWVYFAVRFLLTRLLSHTSQAEMVAQRIFPKPEQTELRRHLIQQINQADPAAYRAAMRSLAFFNTEHRLSEISAPVLVVTGEMDNTVPPETQKRLAKGLPHCEQITIDGCGHGATVEKPAEFNQILLEFIMIDP